MIRTVLKMCVRAGCAEEFEQVWRAAAAVSRHYPGAGPQTMLRDPRAPLRYTITADWATREDLTVYQKSVDREALSAALERLRESASKNLYEVVAHVTAAAPVTVPAPAPPTSPPATASPSAKEGSAPR